jgi:hypothetical protein
MKLDLHSRLAQTSPKLSATLTLVTAVTASSAVAIANAEGGQRHAHPDKAKSCASSSPCLEESNTSSGIGIEGTSSSGVGVFGYSASNYGMEGESDGFYAAVGGYNYDTASGASGVYGQSEEGYGVTGYSASSTGYAMYAEGNILATGDIYTGGSCHSGCSKTRHQVRFVSSTSQPTTDDVGEAMLRNGVAHVALSADFANTIDTHKPYVVLVTPEGAASLYVASRTSEGFEVRELGGHSNVSFAYRIVAKPYGSSDQRLPFKTARDYSANARR